MARNGGPGCPFLPSMKKYAPSSTRRWAQSENGQARAAFEGRASQRRALSPARPDTVPHPSRSSRRHRPSTRRVSKSRNKRCSFKSGPHPVRARSRTRRRCRHGRQARPCSGRAGFASPRRSGPGGAALRPEGAMSQWRCTSYAGLSRTFGLCRGALIHRAPRSCSCSSPTLGPQTSEEEPSGPRAVLSLRALTRIAIGSSRCASEGPPYAVARMPPHS
jgi:hypothetical protein